MRKWIVVLAVALVALPLLSIVHADPRRETGESNSGPIFQGEPAIAGFFRLASGKEAAACYTPSSPEDGTIYSGVVFPYQEEIAKFPVCRFGFPTATRQVANVLIKVRVSAARLDFVIGSFVAAFEIVLQNGQKSDEPCVSVSTPASGSLINGVINPNLEEVKNLPRCWFDRVRRYTGVGQKGPVHQGEPASAGYFQLNSGLVAKACYSPSVPGDGIITSGVVYPAGDEINLPECVFYPRRETGEGQKGPVYKNEPAAAGYFLLKSGFHAEGCFSVSLPDDGEMISGVAHPFPDEVSHLPRCVWTK